MALIGPWNPGQIEATGIVCGFFYFRLRQGWIQQNPMLDVGTIKVKDKPTDYFPQDEFNAIIDATYLYKSDRWEQDDRFGERLRTLKVNTPSLLLTAAALASLDPQAMHRARGSFITESTDVLVSLRGPLR